MKLRPLTKQKEKLLLAGVLCHLDGELPNGRPARFKREILGLGLGLLFAIVGLCAVIEPNIYKAALIGISFTTGLLLGVAVWHHTSAVQMADSRQVHR
jgi:hypothetical protein